MNTTPARSNVVVLKQLRNQIPPGMIHRIARETGMDAKARTFSVVSHLAAMLLAHLTRAIGLNDVCDWLRHKTPVLARFGVTPPSRNDLSHANKERGADFIENPFWVQLGNLQQGCPEFSAGRQARGLLRRFKVTLGRQHRINHEEER